jgi:hypothetical protein
MPNRTFAAPSSPTLPNIRFNVASGRGGLVIGFGIGEAF